MVSKSTLMKYKLHIAVVPVAPLWFLWTSREFSGVSVQGNKDEKWVVGSALCPPAFIVQLWGPQHKKADCTAAFQYLKGTYERAGEGLCGRAVLTGQEKMALNLKWIDLYYIWGSNSSLRGWWDTETGYTEKFWMPHPWKSSRSVWMNLWAAWASIRCSLPVAGKLELDEI